MSELQTALIFLVVAYLIDCIWLVHRRSVVLCRWPRRWQVLLPSVFAGTRSTGLVLLDPLPLHAQAFVCHGPSLSMTADGVLTSVSQVLGQQPLPVQSEPLGYWPWHEITSVSTDGHRLLINGAQATSCPSASAAQQTAVAIDRLRQVPTAERATELRGLIGESFDADAAGQEVTKFLDTTRTLDILCGLLFLIVLLVIPLTVWRFGLFAALAPALLALVVFPVTVVQYIKAHRSLFAGTSSPTEAVMMMVLCPPLAMRAVATLSRDLLTRFHPLAASAVLCTRSSFAQMAGQVLRDLHHPTAPILPVAEHRRLEASFRALLVEAVEELVRSRNIDPGELLAPPKATDGCAWYCPRCHCQLRVRHNQCPDCPGVALRSFDHGNGGS